MSTKIDAQALLNVLETYRGNIAGKMYNAEADGSSDRDFFEGVWQGLDEAIKAVNKMKDEN